MSEYPDQNAEQTTNFSCNHRQDDVHIESVLLISMGIVPYNVTGLIK